MLIMYVVGVGDRPSFRSTVLGRLETGRAGARKGVAGRAGARKKGGMLAAVGATPPPRKTCEVIEDDRGERSPRTAAESREIKTAFATISATQPPLTRRGYERYHPL